MTSGAYIPRETDLLAVNRYTGAHFQFPAEGSVIVTAYGAVMDGSTDGSTALADAIAAAAAQPTGGTVIIPPGKLRIRQPTLLAGSTFGAGDGVWGKPVTIQGAGDGATVIVWDPVTLSDDCFRFWYSGGAYVGGGVRDLSIVNALGTATGAGIRLTGSYRSLIQNVTVSGFLGTNGVGVRIDRESTPLPAQHPTLINVHTQGCYNGIRAEGCAEAAFYHLNLNQNAHAQGLIESGQFAWFGGMIQGGNASLEFRPVGVNSIDFRAYGLHCEVLGVPTLKAYSAGGVYSGRLKLSDCFDNGNTCFVDADFYTTEIESYEGVAPIIAKLRSGVLFRGELLDPTPARYDFDAVTLQNSCFYHAGNVTIGQLPETPIFGGAALAVTGSVKVWPRTTVQRNALVPATGWVIFNTTTGKLETWNGAAWV